MGQFGPYWEQAILKHIAGILAMTQYTVWVAACTAAPMTAGGTNMALAECETNAGAYTRQPIYTAGWTTVSGSTPAVVRNTNKITWTTATLNWGSIGWIALLNTSTVGANGEVLAWGTCTVAAVTTGDTLSIGTQSLTLQVT